MGGKFLREEIVILIRNLLKILYYLLLFVVICRLILLDKNFVICLIGIGEVFRWIIGKIVFDFLKESLKRL